MCDNTISAKNPDLVDQAIKILEEKKASAKVLVPGPPLSQENEPKESHADAPTSENIKPEDSNADVHALQKNEPAESHADRAEPITK